MFPEREEPYEVKLYEYKNNRRRFGNAIISGTEVRHAPRFWSSSSFRIEADGKSMVYTGDCGYDERFVKLAKGADLGLFEMSVPSWMYKKGAKPGHISPYECGLIASEARVKKLALVHLYDNDSAGNIEKEVRKNFGGELFITKDLQKIVI